MTTEPWEQGNVDAYSSAQIRVELQKSMEDIAIRATKVHQRASKAIADKLGCWDEIARVLFLLNSENNISLEVGWQAICDEFARRDKINEELPDIPTFRLTFGVTEAAWTHFFYLVFPDRLSTQLNKLKSLESGVWGDQMGEPEDAALWVIERMLIGQNFVKPVIERWKADHGRASAFCGVRRICAGLLGYPLEGVEEVMHEALSGLKDKLVLVMTIANDFVPSAWTQKANQELSFLSSSYSVPLPSLPDRLLYELIIEVALLSPSSSSSLALGDAGNASPNVSSSSAQRSLEVGDVAIDLLEKEIVSAQNAINHQQSCEIMHHGVQTAFSQIVDQSNTPPIQAAVQMINEIFRRFDLDIDRDEQTITAHIMDYLDPQDTALLSDSLTALKDKLIEFMSALFIYAFKM